MKQIAALLLLLFACAALSATDPLVLVDQNAKPYELCGSSPELTPVPSQPQHQRVLVDGNGYTYVPNCGGVATPESQGYVSDVQAATVSITATGTTTLNVPSNLFSKADVGKTIIITGAGADLLAGANTGTLAPGSAYTNGTYAYVPLTCSTCADSRASEAFATITVSGGNVTAVNTATGGGQEGYYYTVGDVLTTPNSFLGGSGSGFTWTLTTTAQAPLRTTIAAYVSATQVTLGAAMNSHVSSNTCGGATCTELIWWGMASGAGGMNDAGAAINKAFASSSVVRLTKGFYALGTTIIPPATSAFHLRCDPGAILLAMSPLSGADPAMQNTPYNAMMTIDYPPSVTANSAFQTNSGSTIEGCTFDQAFTVKDAVVDRSFKIAFINDFMNNGWGGSTTAPGNVATGPGSNLTVLNHGQGATILTLNFNNGQSTAPGQGSTVSQQIVPAHCMDIIDTDVQVTSGYCNAYGDTSVLASSSNTITATTSSGSPNLVVSAMTAALHIGDRISDDGTAISGGQSLIPKGTYIVAGPVNGMATPFFTTTITSGSASIATSSQALVAGQEVILVGGSGDHGGSGSSSMGTLTGLNLGQVYFVNATGLTSTTVQLCAAPSCAAGSIVPAGGGTGTPIGQGVYTGTSGTFYMSANATGTSAGNDTVKVGEVIVAGGCSGTGSSSCFTPYGGSAPHFLDFHSFQASGATALGPCWQADVSPMLLAATDQCDNQAAIADGVNVRFGSTYISGFFSNLGTSYYVGTRGVRIDPSINSNPPNISVLGTVSQGYGSQTARLYQDNSSGKNNNCIEAAGAITVCGTANVSLSDDNGTLTQFNDPGGTVNNFIVMQPSLVGTAAGITVQTNGAVTSVDLGLGISAKNAAAGSNQSGGILNLNGGNGDSTAGDNQAGGNANLTGGNGFGNGAGGALNLVSGNGGTGAASGQVNIKASATGSSVGAIQIGQATAGAVNISVGASTGAVHIDDGTGTGNVLVGNSANQVNLNSGWVGVNGVKIGECGTTPTIGAGFGSTASFSPAFNCSESFSITASGTGQTTTTALTAFPALAGGHKWFCVANDETTNITSRETSNSTTSLTMTWSAAPTANDVLDFICWGI